MSYGGPETKVLLGGIDRLAQNPRAAALLLAGAFLAVSYAWEVVNPDTTFWSKFNVPQISCAVCGGPPFYYLAFFALCEEHGKELFGG